MKSTWAWTHRLSSNLPWELFFSGSQEGFFSRDKGETFLQARFLLGSLCGHQLSSFGDSEDNRIQEKEQTFYNTRAFDFFLLFLLFYIGTLKSLYREFFLCVPSWKLFYFSHWICLTWRLCVDLALSNVFSVFSACFLNRECSWILHILSCIYSDEPCAKWW